MFRLIGALLASSIGVLLAGSSSPAALGVTETASSAVTSAPRIEPILPLITIPAEAPRPIPPSPEEALNRGVLIVISLPSQRMYVFKGGALWGSSPVSTGRRGHATPPGVFPILQKRVRHRSNLYNAPMPYMQRLTWDGVALHAGHLPGRPASHGCVRLPWNMAKSLFAITGHETTAVVVTPRRLGSADQARATVGGPAAPPDAVQLAERPVPVPGTAGPVQTIQLAAATNPADAEAFWGDLLQRRPELATLQQAVIPATVASRKVFRLRAAGANAHAICRGLASRGVACLKVAS